MPIFIYSDQNIPENEKVDRLLLGRLGKTNPRIGYIPSASDTSRRYYSDKVAYYRRYGINEVMYFDLNKEYRPELLDDLLACDAIHLSGGDPYQFNQSIRKREFGPHLRGYLQRGGTLVGVSAGAIVMTPSIEISNTFYNARADDYRALGLIPFHFMPHLNLRQHRFEELKRFTLEKQAVIYGCHDGDGIVIDGDSTHFVGNVTKFENGHLFPPGSF